MDRPKVRLFDLPGLPADEPEPPPLSYGRRLTARNNRTIELGYNPATLKPLLRNSAPGCTLRCKDCANAIPTGRNVKTYWKCRLNLSQTRGAKTDIRLKWPACVAFERTSVPSEAP